MNNKYYKESGKITIPNLILAIVISVIFSFFLGYIYSLLIYNIPFIYFNIAITIGLGIGVSLLVRLISRIGKIRNKNHRYIISGLIILMTIYFQWITFLNAIMLNSFPSLVDTFWASSWILKPTEFFHLIGQINENGTWGLGTSGNLINGLILTLIWIGEVVIIAFPTIKMQFNFKPYPFSEKFNKWYPKYTIDEFFETIYSKESIEAELDNSVIKTLSNLKLANNARCSKIHIYYIDDEANHYLSIDKVWIDGKGNTKKVNVLSNYTIESEALHEIKNLFKLKKERIDIV